MENSGSQQPYRATRLWNEVILAFRTGMPLKRHRYRIRHYKDCFTAADCISWLNCYLKNNPNFGPQVTRQQTVQLLRKFVKSNVIESITCRNNVEFDDNSHLYRFVQYSPPKSTKQSPLQVLLRTPLSSLKNRGSPGLVQKHLDVPTSKETAASEKYFSLPGKKNAAERFHAKTSQASYPECHFVERRLSVQEVESIWHSVAVTRLEQLISPIKIEDVMDMTKLCKRTIVHNATKVSRTGVVTLVDKADDIPHWVMSAMKCLANWPEATGTGSCLPKYPGFEKDVFKVVKNHFLNPQVALIPEGVQKLLFMSFFRCAYPETWNELNEKFWAPGSISDCTVDTHSAEHSQCKTSTPVDKSKFSMCNNFSPGFIQSAEGQILLNDSRAMWENPLSAYYETEFATVSPVTRVVPSFCKDSDSVGSVWSLAESVHSTKSTSSTISACTYASGQNKDSDGDNGLQSVNLQVFDGPSNNSSFEQTVISLSESFSTYCTMAESDSLGEQESLFNRGNSHQDNCDSLYVSCQLSNDSNEASKHEHVAEVSSPSVFPLTDLHVTSLLIANQNSVAEKPEDHSMNKYNERNLKDNSQETEVLNSRSGCCDTLASLKKSNWKETFEIQERETLKEVMQIILLFIPTSNRRQLHLLLRMMNKITRNEELVLDSAIENKYYLLQTFLPAVMSCGHSTFQEDTMRQIFSIMVNECDSFFKPPSTVKDEATRRIADLQRRRQYEQQKVHMSQQALLDLLENIVIDEKLPDKEKQRRIKQFKENHPDVYKKRFPNPEDAEKIFSKPRKQLLSKFLGLRM